MIDNISVDIYGRDVAFLVEVTPEEFDRFYYDNVTRITDEEYKAIKEDIQNIKGVGGATWWLDSGMPLVYLRDGKSDIFVPHEIFHVCNKILCAAGVNHDADAEPWAYLIGWMTNEYYRKYWAWVDSKEEVKK
jgi:hypothetical protein